MSHYDCDNCGSTMGLFWGHCTNCTPKEYLDMKEEAERIYKDIKFEFDEYIEEKKDKWMDSRLKKTKYYEIIKKMKDIREKEGK